MKVRFYLIVFSIFITLFSCSEVKNEQLANLELLPSSFTGIDFQNSLTANPLTGYNFLSYPNFYHGGGVGMGDFNNDGLTDLFFTGSEVENRIYRNLGDLKFEDVTSNSGVNTNKIWSTGVSIIDINNDNLLDIYVSQSGPDATNQKNLFYINKGNFKFEEQANTMGLDDNRIGTQAVFLDYDKDGDLDVFLLTESKYSNMEISFVLDEIKDPKKLFAASNQMFRNDGDLKFTNITKEAGLTNQSFGLGVLVSDFNEDNYPDIYVSNDYSVPDRMYINQKNGTFKDMINTFTNSISYFSMGCDVADINNDGYKEIAVVDMATSDHFRGKTLMESMNSGNFRYFTEKLNYQYQYMFNAFQLNNGNNTYSNIAGFSGTQKTDWSWAALLADFDMDGYKDYFVSNGFRKYARDNDFRAKMEKLRTENNGSIPLEMRAELYNQIPEVPLRNLLYINDKTLHFAENPDEFNYPNIATYSNGAAYGDLDNDGDLELVVSNIDAEAHILKNNSRENKQGNYLTVKLESPANNGLKYNSKIKISYDNQIQVSEYSFTRGYMSSMDQRVFFALGQSQKIDKVEILWSDDTYQIIENPKINTQLEVVYKQGNQGTFDVARNPNTLLKEIKSEDVGINYKHQENYFIDFNKEILLPQKQSTMGPALAVDDINQDGLDDVYVGGAKGQTGQFYLQKPDGTFQNTQGTFLALDTNSEDLDAAYVDANGDGTKELIVASGGGGDMEGETAILEDRFYAMVDNNYRKVKNVLEPVSSSTYRIKSIDLDQDEKEELLILGSAKPGRYPLSEKNRLLSYQGNKYVDVTAARMPDFNNIPLARDVAFTKINKDDFVDLLVVSEWGKPTMLVSDKDGNYSDQTSTYIKTEKFGWWQSITATDIDNDGDMDFILGNIGKNMKHKVSEEKPLYLYANDFDKNGTLDVVLAKEYNGKIVPARGRECSSEQMPFITDKFKTYTEFANADIVDILGEKSIEESSKYKATDFGSYILRNNNGLYEYEELPAIVQVSPVLASVVIDLNGDGFEDLIVGGNYYDTEYETPRQDAGRGVVLINQKGESYKPLSVNESGLNLNGNFRKLAIVNRKNDRLLLAAENNGPLKIYKLPN